jgi:hypothetical protein
MGYLYAVLLVLSTYVSFANSTIDNSDAKNDRRTKVSACFNLVRSVLHHDTDYLQQVRRQLQRDHPNEPEFELVFLRKTVLNCYNTITLIQSAELVNKRKYQNINPFTEAFKNILNFHSFNEKYNKSNDPNGEKFKKDLEKLNEILSEEEFNPVEFKKLYKASLEKAEKEAKEEQENREKEYEEMRKERGRAIGEEAKSEEKMTSNLNVAFFDKMSPRVRNLVGLGLMVVVALALYFGLKSLKREDIKKEKKKKKN